MVDALLNDLHVFIYYVNYVNYKIVYFNSKVSMPYGSFEIAHYNTIHFITITVYSQ